MSGYNGNTNASIRRFHLTESHRQKIQVTKLLQILMEYVDEEREIDRGRLKAIDMLLKKCMPDLKAVDLNVFQGERTEQEVLSDIRALVRDRPELLSHLAGTAGGASQHQVIEGTAKLAD
jgi:hypothetical protein